MKFTKYINEGVNVSFSDILITLYTHCMPYINEVSKNKNDIQIMMSGRRDNRDFFTKDIRSNRRPVDMPSSSHKIFDDAFYKRFGFRARSNAIFTTGRYLTALGYGDYVYMIFPVGQYRYVWNPNIHDLYEHIAEKMKNGDDDDDTFDEYVDGLIKDNVDDWKGQCEKTYNKNYGEGGIGYWEIIIDKMNEFSSSGLSEEQAINYFVAAIKNFNRFDDDKRTEIIKRLKGNPKKFMTWKPEMEYKKFQAKYKDNKRESIFDDTDIKDAYYNKSVEELVDGYTDKNQHAAIKSENEIMLNCKSYYAVSQLTYSAAMKSYIKVNGTKKPTREVIIDWYMNNNRVISNQIRLFNDISNDDILKGKI